MQDIQKSNVIESAGAKSGGGRNKEIANELQ